MPKIAETPLGPAPPPVTVHRAWYRRPLLIIPLLLAVLAAIGGTLFFTLSGGGITVRGTIIDRLTGQPVTAASVHGGGKSATANARGRFQLAGIGQGTALRVQARYYAPAQVKASATAMTVRLAPVPVAAAVTSALTGRPLPATLGLPSGDRVQLRADGTATLYRIGPGETVTVAAAGYRPGRAAVGSGHTVRAALEPTMPTLSAQLWTWDSHHRYQAIADWVLRPATGYIFMGTGPQSWARENREIKDDPQTAYIGGGYTADGTGVTLQIAWPQQHWDPAGIAGLIGGPVHPVTLAGRQAWHTGPTSDGVYTTMWSFDPVLVSVTGTSEHQGKAVMAGIIKAMTSPAP